MRFPPDRAGWMVVTRDYRTALFGLVTAAALSLLTAAGLVLAAARHRPFEWYEALWLLIVVVWTVRMIGNVLWLRREREA